MPPVIVQWGVLEFAHLCNDWKNHCNPQGCQAGRILRKYPPPSRLLLERFITSFFFPNWCLNFDCLPLPGGGAAAGAGAAGAGAAGAGGPGAGGGAGAGGLGGGLGGGGGGGAGGGIGGGLGS